MLETHFWVIQVILKLVSLVPWLQFEVDHQNLEIFFKLRTLKVEYTVFQSLRVDVDAHYKKLQFISRLNWSIIVIESENLGISEQCWL